MAEAENSVRVEFEVKLTNEDIDDIMVCALEGGINGWCKRAKIVENKYFGDYASDQISRGGSLRLYDNESNDTWVLTKESFLKGLKLWFEGQKPGPEYLDDEGNLDASEIDSVDADAIVQYALFGEIVFG